MSYRDEYGYKKIEWDKEQQINLKDGAKSLRSKKEFKSAKIKISFAVLAFQNSNTLCKLTIVI